MEKNLKINGNKGFHITFKNGVTVSVQFGPGNYCDNYHEDIRPLTEGQESNNAEVAIWTKNTWITKEYDSNLSDDVIPRAEPDEILKILNWAANR